MPDSDESESEFEDDHGDDDDDNGFPDDSLDESSKEENLLWKKVFKNITSSS